MSDTLVTLATLHHEILQLRYALAFGWITTVVLAFCIALDILNAVKKYR